MKKNMGVVGRRGGLEEGRYKRGRVKSEDTKQPPLKGYEFRIFLLSQIFGFSLACFRFSAFRILISFSSPFFSLSFFVTIRQ